jgi:large subunit ribosomal protein L25
MKSIAIKSSSRTELGKKSSTMLRRSGKVPCVLYGGKEPVHFTAPEMDFKKLVYTPDVYTVDLSVDNKEFKAVMRDIQFHPVTSKIVHIDFQEIAADKPVVIAIPIKINGTASGVREGGVLVTKMRTLKVKALPGNLPDRIEIDVTELGIGKSVRVKDITIPNAEILDAPQNTITGVRTARAVVEETPVVAAVTTEGAVPAAEGAVPAAEGAAAKEAPKKDDKTPAKK